jgi:hypothetical protein
MIRDAERILELAAVNLRTQYSRDLGGMGVPEAVEAASSGDLLARVVAERALVNAGIDVWWSDLLCVDGEDAASTVRSVLPIDPEQLYGDNWEAVLGLLKAATALSAAQLNGIGNLVDGATWRLFDECYAVATGAGRERLLMHVCEDVHFATAHYATTPAGVQRRLRSIRGLECVAVMLVLHDVLSDDTRYRLSLPAYKIIYPIAAMMR